MRQSLVFIAVVDAVGMTVGCRLAAYLLDRGAPHARPTAGAAFATVLESHLTTFASPLDEIF